MNGTQIKFERHPEFTGRINYDHMQQSMEMQASYESPINVGIGQLQGDVTSGDYLFNKAYAHFYTGGKEPMNVDASTVNLGNVTQKDLTYNQKTGTYSLDLYKTNPASQTSLALGKISFNHEGGNQYSINPDYYNFNIEWQNGFSKRNIATFGAAIGHYNVTSLIFGGPFWINFQGTITINK